MCRAPGSAVHRAATNVRNSPPDPYPSTHLQQWHHLPGSAEFRGVVAGSDRRERLHEYPEHADRKLTK